MLHGLGMKRIADPKKRAMKEGMEGFGNFRADFGKRSGRGNGLFGAIPDFSPPIPLTCGNMNWGKSLVIYEIFVHLLRENRNSIANPL